MRSHALWRVGFFLLASGISFSSVRSIPVSLPAAPPDPQVWVAPARNSEFAAIGHLASLETCAGARPPQALATPNPLLDWSGFSSKIITVSFIVGVDGRVHSPLILEGSGAPEDQAVLEAVSSWRYRPATCNGVAMESEGKIAFEVAKHNLHRLE
jgi:TonB family protein